MLTAATLVDFATHPALLRSRIQSKALCVTVSYMEIAITGSSGLIGSALVEELSRAGHRPIRMVRRPVRAGADEIFWDPATGEIDGEALEGVHGVVNLAGAGIGDRRWSDQYRNLLVSSRVDGTALLATTCASLKTAPAVLVSGSAVGYYGSRADEKLTEESQAGQGFLAELCRDWEAAAQPAIDSGVRTVLSRTGIVLTPKGGALGKLLPLFKLGVGGRFGSGEQYMSWVSIDDMVGALMHFLSDESTSGAYNITAPEPVTNNEFTSTLAEAVNRPAIFPVPQFGPRLLMGGDRADALLFDSMRVLPERLLASGYRFEHSDLASALADILGDR